MKHSGHRTAWECVLLLVGLLPLIEVWDEAELGKGAHWVDPSCFPFEYLESRGLAAVPCNPVQHLRRSFGRSWLAKPTLAVKKSTKRRLRFLSKTIDPHNRGEDNTLTNPAFWTIIGLTLFGLVGVAFGWWPM